MPLIPTQFDITEIARAQGISLMNTKDKILRKARNAKETPTDDSVVYTVAKCKDSIEYQLNEDLKLISTYFQSNQLKINPKKGNTEAMLFGTAIKLSKCDKELALYYEHTEIQTTQTYRYLGTTLDSTLSLSSNFDKM
eukprot:gene11212-12389_t